MPDVDDGGIEIGTKERLKGALDLLGVGRFEVLQCRIGRTIGMRID